MRQIRSDQHFFTVRGRGFDLKQWSRILSVVEEIVKKANEGGLAAVFKGDAQQLVVGLPETNEILIVRKGEPNIPKRVRTQGKSDILAQTILTAIKKIAPDKFEMTSPDGRDYRRLLAKDSPRGEGAWSRMKRLDHAPQTKEEAFLRAMSKQKWRHPDTGNQVEFISLPKKDQTKLRNRWEQEFGDQYQRALQEAKQEAEQAHKEMQDASKAVKKLDRVKEKAEKAKGLEDAYEKTLNKVARNPLQEKKVNSMNEDIIRKAAIRVAASTKDPGLKRELLNILSPKQAKEEGEKKSRFEEGVGVDVGTWLKQNGYTEAAKKWESHEGEIGKKSSIAQVFPQVYDLAWQNVREYAKAHSDSKVASGSTASRVTASSRLAKEWIQDAIKRPGRVHKYLGIPEDQDIPVSKLDSAIDDVKKSGDKSLLSALLMAKRLKNISKKKAADDAWLNVESFTKAATEIWGSKRLATQWINDAIQHPGRIRKYLGIPEGEDIPTSKLDSAIDEVKGKGDKSLLSALLLAKRLKKMHKTSE